MKKIIVGASALVLLASCGAPKIESPEQALLKNQQEVVENYSKLLQATPEQSNSQGSMKLEVSAPDGDFNTQAQYNFDSNNTTGETSGNLNLSIEAKSDNAFSPFSLAQGVFDIDLIALKNKVLFKVNTLSVQEPKDNPMVQQYVSMIQPYLEKWYFVENMNGQLAQNPIDMIQLQKNIINILENKTLFTHVTTHENPEYYDYDVHINEETFIEIVKEINTLTASNPQNQLDESDFSTIKKDIQSMNETVNMNIKISKEDLETFIFTAKNEDAVVSLENNNETMNISIDDNGYINVNAIIEKHEKGFQGNLVVTESDSEVFSANMQLTTDLKNTDISVDGKMTQANQEVTFNLQLADKTEEKSVEIVEPSETTNFQDVVMEFMTKMWAQQSAIETQDASEVYIETTSPTDSDMSTIDE